MIKWAQLKEFIRSHWYYGGVIFGSIGLTLLIQWLQLGSFVKVFEFIGKSPFYFLINLLIIIVSLSFILIVKRKWFCFSLVTFIWGFLALANAIVLHLMFADIFLIEEAAKLINLYFTPTVMIIFAIIVILLLVGMFFLLKIKTPVKKRDYLLFTAIFIPVIYGLYGIEKQNIMMPDKVNYVWFFLFFNQFDLSLLTIID